MVLSKENMLKYSAHLRAYKSACGDHPELKSFDSKLQQKTSNLINSFTSDAKTGLVPLPQHAAYKEFTKHLAEVNQQVSDYIIGYGEVVWENSTLRSLVETYFESAKKTLDIAENRYENTLRELKKFEAMGNNFDGDKFTTLFKLMHKEQESLLERVRETKEKLDEELKNIGMEISSRKKWSIISNVLFIGAFVAVAVGSMVLLCTGVGTGVGVAGLLSLPLIAIGWVGVHTILENKIEAREKQEEALKKAHRIANEMDKGMETDKVDMNSISGKVHALKSKITSMLNAVKDATEDGANEVDTKQVMETLTGDVVELTEDIKVVGDDVAKYSKMIEETSYHVLQKITGSGK
ncbi:unnamed protein product [Arabidopsis thaliana]|uniref:(thale cress) hypothetical protein n=1 Tax=Arabidopsis thaliana TaxID=3702 RepID=A0A7G2ERE2_ARATH|nr:unnamed protein product [Arabidopsis thaliana]